MFLMRNILETSRVLAIWTVRKEHKVGCLKLSDSNLNRVTKIELSLLSAIELSPPAGQAPAGHSSSVFLFSPNGIFLVRKNINLDHNCFMKTFI